MGRVTPVTHYTMGGVRVDGDGRVVRNEARAAKTGQKVVPGLFAPSASSSGRARREPARRGNADGVRGVRPARGDGGAAAGARRRRGGRAR